MNDIKKLFEIGPYSLKKEKKGILFKKMINQLTHHHYSNSIEYKRLLNFFGFNYKKKKI